MSVLVRGDADSDGVVDESDCPIIMGSTTSAGGQARGRQRLPCPWTGTATGSSPALDAQRNLLYRYTITQTGGEEE